jgi:mono/diheme cytochrome c family protein
VRPAAVAAMALAAALGEPQASAAPMRGPRLDYVLQCMGCHREDGRGAPGRVPSLVDEPGRLLRVPGGRAYLVRVPGVANAPLDDAAVAALLNWMLATFSADTLPADFAPYTADEVTALRATPLADAGAVRRALTAALSDRAPQPDIDTREGRIRP